MIDVFDRSPTFWLAPMAGISNMAFRLIAKKEGADIVCTEMISADGVFRENLRSWDLTKVSEDERPVSIQLFGNDPEVMARAARMMEHRADIIDLNFGCPAKKIVKNGSGSALMKHPKLLGEIVAEVVDAVSIPVTAKIRAGWDVDSINAVEVSQIIEDSGASAVIVHPRTKSQAFSGHSDWKIIGDVKESVSISVIGNGDVNTPEDAEEMLGLTGCDGVMIGRGAMGNPWIFSRSIQYVQTGNLPEEPADTEKVMHLLKFARELVRLKDEYTGCREIRKFVKWYTKGMPNAKDFRKKAVLVESLEQLEMLVLSYIHTYAEVVENEVC